MIYLQNMKFMGSILWPGVVYTDNTYTDKAKIMIPYYDEIVNHNYIGSFWQCQMSQKSWKNGSDPGKMNCLGQNSF